MRTATLDAWRLDSPAMPAPHALRTAQAQHAAHSIEWDAIASLSGAALEAALADVTGIRCDDARSDGATTERALLLDDEGMRIAGESSASLLHSDAGQVEMRSTLAVIRDASRTVPDVTTALVLSAVMHDDVLTAHGRVVMTRLTAHLGATGTPYAARAATGQALAAALDHVARGTLDTLDAHGPTTVDCDHDYAGISTVDPAARRAATHAARLADDGTRFIGRMSPTVPEPGAVILTATQPRPWSAPAPEQDHTPSMTRRRDGWRLASFLLGDDGPGNGMGTTPSGLPSRDALRRVSLAAGSTITHESLAGPLTRDSGRASTIPGTLTVGGITRASWVHAGQNGGPCMRVTRAGVQCRRSAPAGAFFCRQHEVIDRAAYDARTFDGRTFDDTAPAAVPVVPVVTALATLRSRGPRH